MVLPAKLSSKSLNKAVGGEQMYRVFMSFLLSNIKAWTPQFCSAKGLVEHCEYEIMLSGDARPLYC